MLNRRTIELSVGLLVVLGFLSLALLALKVSGISQYSARNTYTVYATFDNVGDLKVRAPVTMAGVHIGEVSDIRLDPKNFRADVTLRIDKKFNTIPSDSSAKILTAGVIGANYVELIPGFEDQSFVHNDKVADTQSAIVIENLVSSLLYSLTSGKDSAAEKDVGDSSRVSESLTVKPANEPAAPNDKAGDAATTLRINSGSFNPFDGGSLYSPKVSLEAE